jgi:protein involved in polysaccharide export with SLBB domain
MKTPRNHVTTSCFSTWRAVLTACLVATTAACSGGPRGQIADEGGDIGDYRLGAGDKVNVSVFGDPNLSGPHDVDGNGVFTFPLAGSIKAAGLTSTELEGTIRTKLKEYLKDPRVSVEILAYRPFYIVGEVTKPGAYPYVNGMNVVNAVAIAGGFTYRAKDDDFDIERKSNNTTLEAGRTTHVLPGDVIVVRERFF